MITLLRMIRNAIWRYFGCVTCKVRHTCKVYPDPQVMSCSARGKGLDSPRGEKKDLTCKDCPDRGFCQYVDDPYNTDGDCLRDK